MIYDFREGLDTDRYSKMSYHHLESDLAERVADIFSSDQFHKMMDHTLDSYSADLRPSIIFHHLHEP